MNYKKNRKRHHKGPSSTKNEPSPVHQSSSPLLFPAELVHLAEQIQQAQQHFQTLTAEKDLLQDQVGQQNQQLSQVENRNTVLEEELVTLKTEIGNLTGQVNALKEQLTDREQELTAARQRADDYEKEVKRLEIELAEEKTEARRQWTQSRVELFKDMAEAKHNYLLRNLLRFHEDPVQSLAEDASRYFRERLPLALAGELRSKIELTQDNMDQYQVEDPVDPPCTVEVVAYGIIYDDDHTIVRIAVDPVEEVTGHGN